MEASVLLEDDSVNWQNMDLLGLFCSGDVRCEVKLHHLCFLSVTEFSKKTGDYPSLSATDIKVLALTYQLELEHVGSQHLRKEPEVKVPVQASSFSLLLVFELS